MNQRHAPSPNAQWYAQSLPSREVRRGVFCCRRALPRSCLTVTQRPECKLGCRRGFGRSLQIAGCPCVCYAAVAQQDRAAEPKVPVQSLATTRVLALRGTLQMSFGECQTFGTSWRSRRLPPLRSHSGYGRPLRGLGVDISTRWIKIHPPRTVPQHPVTYICCHWQRTDSRWSSGTGIDVLKQSIRVSLEQSPATFL
jgi:hypothetical protein